MGSCISIVSEVFVFVFVFLNILFCMYASMLEEGIRSHYRGLWDMMWLLVIELRISRRAASTLNL